MLPVNAVFHCNLHNYPSFTLAEEDIYLLIAATNRGSLKRPNRGGRMYASTKSAADIIMDRESLSEWAKDKPLSILQLDPADRAVLRIAGKFKLSCVS